MFLQVIFYEMSVKLVSGIVTNDRLVLVVVEEERHFHVHGLHTAGRDVRDGQRCAGREEPGPQALRS